MSTILEALSILDVDDDEQWTSDGLPKVDVVRNLVENDELKRADITEAAPEFNRDAARAAKDSSDADDSETGSGSTEQPSQDPNQPTPPETEEVDTRSLEEKLADELCAVQVEMAEVTKAQAKLNEERNDLARRIAFIGGQLDKERSKGPVQSGITQYLASQNKIREEKAAKIAALNEAGIPELVRSLGISKLDAAMRQRKPARGSQRPNRPLL